MVFVCYGSVFVCVLLNRFCKIDDSFFRIENEEMKKIVESEYCSVYKDIYLNEIENGNKFLEIIVNKEIVRNVDNVLGNVYLKVNDKIIYKLDLEE